MEYYGAYINNMLLEVFISSESLNSYIADCYKKGILNVKGKKISAWQYYAFINAIYSQK
jgi:limonene-1,2-epoxide hydrolase